MIVLRVAIEPPKQGFSALGPKIKNLMKINVLMFNVNTTMHKCLGFLMT